MEDLEVEYTPSLFSKRFSNREELIANFLSISLKETEKNRKNLDCHLNISYGSTQRQKLDIYGDDLPSSAPLFVFVHGGYWQMLDKNESAVPVAQFVKRGIRVIIVDYDLCPNKTLEEIVNQIRDCFMWISNYVKKNSIKSLSIAGHSAGAHLLACGLTQNFVSSLDNVRLSNYFISGIYYLNELKDLETSNPNGILSLNDDNWKKLSPQFYDYSHLESSNVKNYVIAGADESKMFVKHSTKFANEPLKDTNVKLMIMENIDHFDVMEKFIEADYELTKLVLENAL